MKPEVDEIVDDLKKYPEVMVIILFGSHAKNKAKPLSDIDIAVITKDHSKEMEAEIASSSSNVLDVANFHRLPLYIQFEVLKYGKPIFVRDEKYFLEIRRQILRDYLEMSPMYERMSKRVLAQ